LESKDQKEAFKSLLSGNGSSESISLNHLSISQVVELIREYGGSALSALGIVAGATTTATLAIVVFILATYTFLAEGDRAYEWLADHAVIPRPAFQRLAGAFSETGRGLIIGTGLTALAQGLLAGIGYAVLGVPRALALGCLTAIAGLVPSVGTALVWLPLAGGFFVWSHWGTGVGVLAVGFSVSLIDNFLRPFLSGVGSLRLPGLLVFLSMLGGVAQFGGWGLMLGPLFARLAVEALEIVREQRTASSSETSRPEGQAAPAAQAVRADGINQA
jgi:predicted PurR-regulated permease PerM